MTRTQHNAYYQADRQPEEQVHCNTLGYGELSQYDPACHQCWLGHRHTWKEHDKNINGTQTEEKPTN